MSRAAAGAHDPRRGPNGRGPFFAHAVRWLIVPLYVAGFFATFFLERGAGLRGGENPAEEAAGVALTLGFGAFAVVGALLVAKRPANLVGWIMAAVALMVSVSNAGGTYAAYSIATRGRPDDLAVLGAWVSNWYWFLMLGLALIYLPMLFPEGRLLSHRWLPVAALAGVAPLGFVLLRALMDPIPVNQVPGPGIDNPIGIEGLSNAQELPISGVLDGLFIAGGLAAVASVVLRFRRSRGIERQQMKWFTFTIAVFFGGAILASAISVSTGTRWLEAVSFVLSIVGLVSLPIAVGIAILRHRLYDIDIIINRALVYATLTATLVAVYFVGVTAAQSAFRLLTGQEQQPQLVVVASTLAIAALFNPLRRRIQGNVDRRFYRKKYDATRTLEAFSLRLRDETDLGILSGDLVGVVRETVAPRHVSLWLRPAKTRKDSGKERTR